MEEIFPSFIDPAEDGWRYIKTPEPTNKRNGNYVGTAIAEGFGPAWSGPYFEGAGEDETIRSKDDDHGHNDAFSCCNEQLYLIYIGAGAGELQEKEKVTEVGLMVFPSQ